MMSPAEAIFNRVMDERCRACLAKIADCRYGGEHPKEQQ